MKKRKMFRGISLLSICLLSIVSSWGVCFAVEQSTTISYNPSYEELVPTKVRIVISAETKRLGEIYDGEKVLGVGETIYQLKHKETITFQIRPAIGYDLDKVIYDREDIRDKLKSGRSIRKDYLLVIEGKGHDTSLEITFRKSSSNDPSDPEKPNYSENPCSPDTDYGQANTGDSTSVYKYVVGVFAPILAIIITLLVKRRTEQ